MSVIQKENLISLNDVYKMDINDIRRLYKEFVSPGIEDVIYTFSFGEDIVETASGIWMYFRTKGKVFDATGGMGVLNIGHNHPRILAARINFQQMQRMEVHKGTFSQYTAALCHNLAVLLEKKLTYSFFCNSGAEAVEGAMKTAYKYHKGKRKSILYADISYHGKTLGAASVTGSSDITFKFPAIPGAHSYVYNSIDSIKQKVAQLATNGSSDIYAILVEPYSISTMTGCSNEFLKELRRICDENEIILIFDEVFSGWYKMGPLFYFMNSDIYPDILTVSKTMGGGKASISAFISADKIYRNAFGNTPDAFLHSTTYNGFGEECITALETINIMIDEDLAGKTKNIENIIRSWLISILEKHNDKVIFWRGSGSFFSFKLRVIPEMFASLLEVIPLPLRQDKLIIYKIESAAFCDFLFREYGIYALFGGQIDIQILFAPSAIVSDDDLNETLIKIENALSRFTVADVISFALRKFKKSMFD